MNNEILQKGVSMWQRMMVVCAMFLCSLAQAQTAIQAVSASVQGGSEVIRIDSVSYTHLTLPTKRIV